jgi:hypothetical protein
VRINKKIQKTIIILFIIICLVPLLEFIHILPDKALISIYTNGLGLQGLSLRKIDLNASEISELQNIINSLPPEPGRFCPLDEGAGYQLYFYTFPFTLQQDFVQIQGCGDVEINDNDLMETNSTFWKFFYSIIPADPRENKYPRSTGVSKFIYMA